MVENSDFTPSQVGCLFTFLARQLAKPDNTLFVNRTLFDQVSVFNSETWSWFLLFSVHRQDRLPRTVFKCVLIMCSGQYEFARRLALWEHGLSLFCFNSYLVTLSCLELLASEFANLSVSLSLMIRPHWSSWEELTLGNLSFLINDSPGVSQSQSEQPLMPTGSMKAAFCLEKSVIIMCSTEHFSEPGKLCACSLSFPEVLKSVYLSLFFRESSERLNN